MKRNCTPVFNFFLTLILFSVMSAEVHAQSGVYVGGHFRRERPSTVDILKQSGMTYVILFNVNVEANGDLTTDGETIVSNGTYVFGNKQPYYQQDVAALKQGITSINRVESCIGGWGNTSYDNIRNLINSQGTGTGSILYRNFAAFKAALPSMDAINNDDEHAYDAATAIRFHVMLKDLGMNTTVAPYTNWNYWNSLITNVNAQRPGAVDRIDLQCYDGGAGNNPCDWRIGGVKLHAGLLNFDSQQTIRDKMTNWKNTCGVTGGFIWVYNDNGMHPGDYAETINKVFGVQPKNMLEAVNVFKHCNNEGFSNGLEAGDYNLARLQSMGILDNDISGINAAQGFEVVLYDGDNFTGTSTVISGNNSCLVNTAGNWNDRVTSLKIRSAGATNLAGTYYLQNRNSGLYMDVSGGTGSVNDGANIAQWTYTGATNQQYAFTHLGDGTYKITAVNSGKALDIDAIKKTDGANAQQWTYFGSLNQQFIAVSTGDGYYKLVAKHCGKIVEVSNASTAAGGNIQQWTNNNQTCGQWKLIPVSVADGTGDGLTGNYFNGMNFEAYKASRKDATINMNWGGGSPITGVNADQFSVRWTGLVEPKYSGEYTFYVNSDNGRRLWVNGQLIIDKWIDDWNIEYSGKITLTAGQKYEIKLEYFENNGGAGCKMEWSSNVQTREVIPAKQLYANTLPVVSLTSPSDNAVFTTPAAITINATASDAGGSIAKVDFYNGDALLGSDNTSPYSFTWNNNSAGKYSISAIATDNRGGVNNSSVVTITVNAGTSNNAPAVSITSPANNSSFNAPASFTINATASDSDGSISKVEFFNGSTSLGSDNTSPYSFTWNNVTAGSYTLTARATDNTGAVTTSSAVTVTVNNVVVNQPPVVSLTSPINNASFNAPATVTINANASDSDGSISKVEFFNGSTSIGSDNSSPYSINWSNVAAGTYTLTAKATDNSGAVTTSSSVSITVKTVVTNLCSGVAQYVENNGYVDGSIVQNAGSRYKCKPYPYTGWCNGAAWAYAPGTGQYWGDAWTLVGSCSARMSSNSSTDEVQLSPNPTSDVVTLQLSSAANVTVYNAMGLEVISSSEKENGSTLDLSSLPSGMYLVKIDMGNEIITKTVLKK